MTKNDTKVKIISLKPLLDSDDAEEMIDSRKVKSFQTLLHKPKKSEIHLHSLTLHFESILLLSGKYSVDFIRDAEHTLSVDKDVQEVIISDEVFPVKKKHGVLSKLEPSFKNKIKILMQERVMLENTTDISFDHHGKEINLSYNDTVKLLEKHPKKTINEDKESIRRPEITIDAAKSKLISKLKRPADAGTKSSEELFDFRDILEIYVPIYEARLIGPKKRVKILRIDAVRKKIL
ncbi:MAG: hypothetical protein HOM82_06075 [Thaumarchaeota archaeon]|jgi:hypothetical protein|nr:hypothetical protein [Candidatus Nitrosopelagicus sp.]MBT4057112.1 hypothetical protein [Nitrososphaerota archaeon]MBT4509439.1 hypothetical protein [Nitrososphaerota archaeon]MBT4973792.1 hypothetical protein [Nitrososphaerota archaeon]MBT5238134.1 hypothetical protein [Nitrososphaerota archaeon]